MEKKPPFKRNNAPQAAKSDRPKHTGDKPRDRKEGYASHEERMLVAEEALAKLEAKMPVACRPKSGAGMF